MYSDFAVDKCLHTVASGWIFINIPYDSCMYTELSQLVAQSQRASGDNDITLFLKVLKREFSIHL
jgi:hypothetical protein